MALVAELPDELWLHVLTFLDMRSLGRAECTSHRIAALCARVYKARYLGSLPVVASLSTCSLSPLLSELLSPAHLAGLRALSSTHCNDGDLHGVWKRNLCWRHHERQTLLPQIVENLASLPLGPRRPRAFYFPVLVSAPAASSSPLPSR
jgi:F-box-like